MNRRNQRMFSTSFRILETSDEHFYDHSLSGINHWPLNGFALQDHVLKKIYHDNAINAFQKAQSNAA